jgi:type III restriction enzyme
MEPVTIDPVKAPTAVFVKPQVGYQVGHPTFGGGFDSHLQDREEYYDSVHLQTIQFEIARLVVWALTEGMEGRTAKLKLRSRHQLFPQVYRLVESYVGRKVNWNGQDKRELGLTTYVQRIVERFIDAVEPDESQGEPPLLPILNRYKPIGSTGEVNFKTTRPCHGTQKSHINQVVLDTASWEQAAAFYLEASDLVAFYARNDHLECTIPYEYLGVSHVYIPDYLVRLKDQTTLVLEVKGWEDDQDRAKHQAARRWVSAVNNWGKLGIWRFHVCRNPQVLKRELGALAE